MGVSASSDILLAQQDLYRLAQAGATIAYARREAVDWLPRFWEAIFANAAFLGVVDASFDPGGCLDLPKHESRPGLPVAVLQAIDEDGETTIDLVGWPIDQPERFATMFRHASILGIANLWNHPNLMDDPLTVHRTPLEWIKAGCEGIVILDMQRAAYILNEVPGRFCCRDIEHAAELAKAMRSLVDLRRIVIPVGQQNE